MARHQMMRGIEGQILPVVARKRPAPEGKGKQVKRVKREPERQQAKPYRRSLRLNSKKAPATDSPTLTYNQEGSTNPNYKWHSEDQAHFSPKQPQLSMSSAIECRFVEKQYDIANWKKVDLIRYWCKNNNWPREYFEAQPLQIENTSHLLTKKMSTASHHYKISTSSYVSGSNAPTAQKSRDRKSVAYRTAAYETILATKGSFMSKSDLGMTDRSKGIYDTFDEFCQRLQGKNDSRIIQDIARLIVPSAESLAIDGANNLKHLVESVNEPWSSSIAFYGSRPQPDYAVGFGRSAFTEDQLKAFESLIGDDPTTCRSYFLGTFYMYFPFLTTEVKGADSLDIADRQNAHSMTLAVRGVVELFKLVGREEELNREILAFSISHDRSMVKIYGHYAIIEGKKTSFYRHPIKLFDFTSEEGKDKWSAYIFTKNVYDIWVPDHLKRIQSAIDEIPPGVRFDISQSGLGLSRPSVPLFLGEDGSQPSRAGIVASAEVTPNGHGH